MRSRKSLIIFAQVTILYMIQNADSYLLVPNFNKIKVDLDVSDTYLGLLSGTYLFFSGISSVLWAFLSDVSSLKRKIFLSSSLIGGGIFAILTYVSNDPVYFFIFRSLTGASLGAIFPLGFGIISDIFSSEKRTKIYMLWYTLGGFGLAFGYGVALFLGSYINWKYVLYAGAMILFFGSFLALTIIEPPKGSAEDEIRDVLEITREYPYRFNPRDIKLIVSNRTNIYITLQGIFGTIPNGVIFTWVVHYLIREVGTSEIAASLLFGIMSVGALGGLLVAHVADIAYKRKPEYRAKIAAISSIAESILFIIFFLTPMKLNLYTDNVIEILLSIKTLLLTSTLFLFWFSIYFVAMFFNSAVGPIKNSVLSDSNLPEHRATVFAGINIVELFAKASGITAVGVLSDVFGTLRIPIIITMFFWIFSGIAWFRVAKHYPSDMKKVDEILFSRRKELIRQIIS